MQAEKRGRSRLWDVDKRKYYFTYISNSFSVTEEDKYFVESSFYYLNHATPTSQADRVRFVLLYLDRSVADTYQRISNWNVGMQVITSADQKHFLLVHVKLQTLSLLYEHL